MGLRDYLLGLQSIQQSTGQFAESAEAMRKQANLEAFNRELPAAIQSGDAQAIAQLGAQYGQQEYPQAYLGALLKQQTEAAKPKKESLTQEQIRSIPGLTEQQYKALESSTPEAQPKLLSAYSEASKQSEKKREFDIGESRRSLMPQRQKFVDSFNKEERSLQDEKRSIDKSYAALKEGSITADNVVFNFLARSLAGEKGPLAKDDIQRMLSGSAEGDATAVMNYITGGGKSKLSDDQRKIFGNLVGLAKGNWEKWQEDRVGTLLTRSVGDYPALLQEKDGKFTLDKSVQERFKKYGYEFDPKEMIVKKTLSKKEIPANDNEALLVQLPSDKRDAASRALEAVKNDPVKLEKVKENIRKAIQR